MKQKTKLQNFLNKYTYEFFMFALVQHLYISMFIKQEEFYARYIWPINMLILGLASIEVFSDKSRREITIKNILVVVSIVLPFVIPTVPRAQMGAALQVTSILYTLFFSYLFYEMLRDLFNPREINKNVILASACGILLLIEILTFSLQFFYYYNPLIIKGIDTSSFISVFTDLVYFSTVTLSTIGYGDITPESQNTKIYVAFFGLIAQFYNVLIVGILVSKFSAIEDTIEKKL